MNKFLLFLFCAACAIGITEIAPAATINSALADLRAVGPEGNGNAQASAAWKELARADTKSLPKILSAMDGANDLAANWLRAAVDTIAARALANDIKLPIASLEKFLRDTKHNPRARRLAYELITRANPGSAEKLLSRMLDNPSTELRRDAVQRVMDKAALSTKGGRTNDAIAGYAFTEFIADKARPVELRLGCKTAWKIWLNGRLLFGRDEYHRGVEIDQYRLAGELKPGRNTILVKVCQNHQTEIVLNKLVFTLNDAGVLTCGDAKDGARKWQLRLKGPYSAAPVAAGVTSTA